MNEEALLQKYFPDLGESQRNQIFKYRDLLIEQNQLVNLVSRKDTKEQIFVHHILHSMSIAHFYTFNSNQQVMDLGSGGGLPGFPLAILFPETKFVLVDSIAKKMKAVQNMQDEMKLPNLEVIRSRAEELDREWDFVVTRAVAPMIKLMKWTRKQFKKSERDVDFKNGIIALKGGDLKMELATINNKMKKVPLQNYFPEIDHFENKFIIHVGMK